MDRVFPQTGKNTILVFLALLLLRNSRESSLSGGVNYTGCEKFTIFDRTRHLGDGTNVGLWLPWHTHNIESHS